MKLEPADFVTMFGGPLDDKTLAEISTHNWRYEVMDEAATRQIIANLNQRVMAKDFSIAGENTERWQTGWQENLLEFRRTGELSALEPKYLRPATFLRLNSQFIKPRDPMFERNWYRVFRGWFARRYLSEFDCIAEFGCGSGHNIAFLAQEFPDKYILGHDWAEASVEIVDELRSRFPRVRSLLFNFFAPAISETKMPRNTAVLTVGALEQTGTRWRPFMDFLKRAQPAMCFHIEPIVEWYNYDNLIDRTAIQIHQARGFQTGFVKEIAPVRQHRTGFGSLLLEGYSQFSWKPEAITNEQARVDALEGAP